MKILKNCDTFRDPRVWRIKNNKWFKDIIWGEESAYGDVHLDSIKLKNLTLSKKYLTSKITF